MRNDIVPGAPFPDYELTDHTATRRKLSELQGTDPMIVVLSRGGFCPKDRRQAEGLIQLHRERKWDIAGLSPSARTTSRRRTNTVAESAHTGLFYPTRAVLFKRISTSRNIPTPCTIQ